MNKVTYLGCQLSETGAEPSNEKVQAVKCVPNPTCVMELKAILGLVNFMPIFYLFCPPYWFRCTAYCVKTSTGIGQASVNSLS